MRDSRFYLRTLRFDWALAAAVVAIAVLGLLNLRSATRSAHADLYTNQLTWMAGGLVMFAIAAATDYRVLQPLAYLLYGVGVAALATVLVVGKRVNGARRWIEIGGLSVQPSEFMKLLLVLAVARFLHDRAAHQQSHGLGKVFVPSMMMAVPLLFILKQPDLGTGLLLFLVFVSLLLLTNLRLRSLLPLGFLAILGAPLTWTYLLKEYQRQRILTFVSPGRDLVGAGWHARQALIAVGSGGLFGKGYLKGTQTQLQFLPYPWTDFPFAVWAEEWGLVGCAVLTLLYFFLIGWALHLASQARDRFGAVLCAGVGALLFWHVVINLGMVLGILPVVGVTLPLFSHGGSSVMTVLAGVGLLMSVSLRRYTL